MDERDAVRRSEVHIRFVDDHWAIDTIGQLQNRIVIEQRSAWAIWVRQVNQFERFVVGVETFGQSKILIEGNFFELGRLKLCERAIENVAWVRKPELLAISDERSGKNCQAVIATVAATVTMIVQSISENQNLLEGANKPAGILAFIAAIATMLGRHYQAGQKAS